MPGPAAAAPGTPPGPSRQAASPPGPPATQEAPARRAGATSCSWSQSGRAQERRGLVMSLGHPFHDVLRVGGVFELHQDRRVVDPQPLDGLEVRGKVNHAPARREITVNLAIAIRDMN